MTDEAAPPDQPPAGGGAGPDRVGPYDSAEAPPERTRLDLGSLKIPSVSGVDVRVQADQEGRVQQVYLVHQESVLQLRAFAAPRTEPIWDEVRDEIRKQLFQDGVAAEEVPGDYGTELRARVRTPQGLQDLRFVGIDGPRWLVRAVFQGPVAVDPGAATPLVECLRQVVVERDDEARPVKEPLPLRLSPQLAAQIAQQRATAGQVGAAGQTGQPVASRPSPVPHPPGAAGANGAAPGGDSAGAKKRKPSPRPRRD